MELSPRSVVDRYTVVSKLGSGGNARVYLVRHNVLQTVHAMKVLRSPSRSVVERLMREGRLQGQLRHPNVVAITDVVEVDGAPGLVMEYVEGPSLQHFLTNHPATLDEVDVIARGILSGVAAAHRAGLIHRDLKPANILLQLADGQLTPKVTDFGLAKALDTGQRSVLQTRQGARLGTPAYMAPEQILDSSNIDEKADIFALGNILYELLAGKRPFRDRDVEALYSKIQTGDFEPIDSVCEGLPQSMLDAVTAALRVKPEDRIATVSELQELWQRDRATPSVSTDTWSDRLTSEAGSLDHSIGTEGTTADTWASESVDLMKMEPPPPKRSVPKWPIAVFAGGLGLAVAAWIATRPPPPPAYFTAETVPVISADPVAQDHFARAWDDFRDADHTEATRRLQVVVDREPDQALVRLFNSVNLMFDGDTAGGIQEMRVCRSLAQDQQGPVAELVHAIVRMQERGDLSGPELPTYLEKYPEDYLAAVMATQWCWAHDVDYCTSRQADLERLDPSRAVVYSAAASGFRPLEAWTEVRAAVERGLELNPDDPDLLQQFASAALGEGDVDTAKDALSRSLEMDHTRWAPKIKLAQLALLQDQPDIYAQLEREILSPGVPPDLRKSVHTSLHTTLKGLGRHREAEEHLAAAQVIEEEHGTAFGVLSLLASREYMARLRGDYERAAEIADQIGLLGARDPSIPDSIRSRMAAQHVQLKGLAAVAEGDLKGAKAALAKLEQAEDVPPQTHEGLVREIAIAEGDADTIKSIQRGYLGSRCDPLMVTGVALHRAGADYDARKLLEEVLESRCSIWFGTLRKVVVATHITLAEIDLSEGHRESAAEHVRIYRELWPNPDPDLPIVQRGSGLEEQLALGQ